jgi:hypothetical protein
MPLSALSRLCQANAMLQCSFPLLPFMDSAASRRKGSLLPFAAPSTKVRNGPEAAIMLIAVKVRFVRLAVVSPSTRERLKWVTSGPTAKSSESLNHGYQASDFIH